MDGCNAHHFQSRHWRSPSRPPGGGRPSSAGLCISITPYSTSIPFNICTCSSFSSHLQRLDIYLHCDLHCLSLHSTRPLWSCPMYPKLRKSVTRFDGSRRTLLIPFAVAIGCMKALDIFVRRNSFPTYAHSPKPHPAILAFILLTELRYESFTPNHIRVPRDAENFSEPIQLALHVGVFMVLQSLPQMFPTILAFEVLLAIYIIWTSLQLLLRYKSSPALFGPLYLADSLSGFWSETWHNAFASPCQSIVYNPMRKNLPKYGVPVAVARSFGVFAAFGLMAIFHMYALAPILPWSSLLRIGWFFFLNGVGTVVEAMIWGKRRHWLKGVLAWTFETALATWVAQAAHIPNGLSHIPWKDMCGPPSAW